MAVRTEQLGAPRQTATGSVTVLTVQSGHLVLLKSVQIENVGNGVATVTVSIRPQAVNGTNVAIMRKVMAVNEILALECWIALQAGDDLRLATTAAAGTVDTRTVFSGADLVLTT